MTSNNIDNTGCSKHLGRPFGTVKRKGGTSRLTIPLTIRDKQWVQDAAQSRDMSMTEFITSLINEKRDWEEKVKAKISKK